MSKMIIQKHRYLPPPHFITTISYKQQMGDLHRLPIHPNNLFRIYGTRIFAANKICYGNKDKIFTYNEIKFR